MHISILLIYSQFIQLIAISLLQALSTQATLYSPPTKIKNFPIISLNPNQNIIINLAQYYSGSLLQFSIAQPSQPQPLDIQLYNQTKLLPWQILDLDPTKTSSSQIKIKKVVYLFKPNNSSKEIQYLILSNDNSLYWAQNNENNVTEIDFKLLKQIFLPSFLTCSDIIQLDD